MNIEVDESLYDIRWRHEQDYEAVNERGQCIHGRTVAYIYTTDGKKIEAYANCSMLDTFSKKLGRWIAVGRLLKMLDLDTKMALKL